MGLKDIYFLNFIGPTIGLLHTEVFGGEDLGLMVTSTVIRNLKFGH